MVGEVHPRSGALEYKMENTSTYGNNVSPTVTLRIDASWSDAIYSASQTVQPSGLRVLPCVKF